jgi:hypothetical protein
VLIESSGCLNSRRDHDLSFTNWIDASPLGTVEESAWRWAIYADEADTECMGDAWAWAPNK